MTATAPVATVRPPLVDTELVRADQVRVGERVGRFGDRVTKVLGADDSTTICLDTPHGFSIADGRSDRMIRVERRTTAD